jgi:hypothetical protein
MAPDEVYGDAVRLEIRPEVVERVVDGHIGLNL